MKQPTTRNAHLRLEQRLNLKGALCSSETECKWILISGEAAHPWLWEDTSRSCQNLHNFKQMEHQINIYCYLLKNTFSPGVHLSTILVCIREKKQQATKMLSSTNPLSTFSSSRQDRSASRFWWSLAASLALHHHHSRVLLNKSS